MVKVKGSVWIIKANKGRKKTMYNVMLSDEKWYGFGDTKPDAEEGDGIVFEASKNGNFWNADTDTVKVYPGKGKKMPADKKKSSSGGGYKKGGYGKSIEDMAGQASGNALTNATNVVVACIEKGLLAIPKTANKQYDAVIGYIKQAHEDLLQASTQSVLKVAPNSPLKALLAASEDDEEDFDSETKSVSDDDDDFDGDDDGFVETDEEEEFD